MSDWEPATEAEATMRDALVTTLAVFLGAAALPYATMMFSHSLVVGLMAIAIWVHWRPIRGRIQG